MLKTLDGSSLLRFKTKFYYSTFIVANTLHVQSNNFHPVRIGPIKWPVITTATLFKYVWHYFKLKPIHMNFEDKKNAIDKSITIMSKFGRILRFKSFISSTYLFHILSLCSNIDHRQTVHIPGIEHRVRGIAGDALTTGWGTIIVIEGGTRCRETKSWSLLDPA